MWATPEFDFTLERPVNASALEVYDRERQAAQMRTAEQLARTHVLFYLFRSDCPYCQRFAPLLKSFEQKFGLPVFAISLDGGTLPEFPRARVDNGIAATLNITQVPALFLASPRTNIITPLMVYFPLVLTFCQRWRTDFGLGSLTASMLPYSFWLLIIGLALTFGWVFLDLPLGPGASVDYALPTPPAAQ